MPDLVTVGQDELTIELSGSTALPSLHRIVRIPLAGIRSIKTDPETASPPVLASLAGPLSGVRSGTVIHQGRRLLLAYHPGDPTITLELDRQRYPEVDYDTVVLAYDSRLIRPAQAQQRSSPRARTNTPPVRPRPSAQTKREC